MMEYSGAGHDARAPIVPNLLVKHSSAASEQQGARVSNHTQKGTQDENPSASGAIITPSVDHSPYGAKTSESKSSETITESVRSNEEGTSGFAHTVQAYLHQHQHYSDEMHGTEGSLHGAGALPMPRVLMSCPGLDSVVQAAAVVTQNTAAFPQNTREYNVETRIPAAKYGKVSYPAPAVSTGHEMAAMQQYPGASSFVLPDYSGGPLSAHHKTAQQQHPHTHMAGFSLISASAMPMSVFMQLSALVSLGLVQGGPLGTSPLPALHLSLGHNLVLRAEQMSHMHANVYILAHRDAAPMEYGMAILALLQGLSAVAAGCVTPMGLPPAPPMHTYSTVAPQPSGMIPMMPMMHHQVAQGWREVQPGMGADSGGVYMQLPPATVATTQPMTQHHTIANAPILLPTAMPASAGGAGPHAGPPSVPGAWMHPLLASWTSFPGPWAADYFREPMESDARWLVQRYGDVLPKEWMTLICTLFDGQRGNLVTTETAATAGGKVLAWLHVLLPPQGATSGLALLALALAKVYYVDKRGELNQTMITEFADLAEGHTTSAAKLRKHQRYCAFVVTRDLASMLPPVFAELLGSHAPLIQTTICKVIFGTLLALASLHADSKKTLYFELIHIDGTGAVFSVNTLGKHFDASAIRRLLLELKRNPTEFDCGVIVEDGSVSLAPRFTPSHADASEVLLATNASGIKRKRSFPASEPAQARKFNESA